MNLPLAITFRNTNEVEGAKKLIAKINPSIQVEELGFLPGRYFVLFFDKKDQEYQELRKNYVSSMKSQG